MYVLGFVGERDHEELRVEPDPDLHYTLINRENRK
jgi:hypothetical protein